MSISSRSINRYCLFKLPAAYFAGVRVSSINKDACMASVRLKWINQNPFKSMFWAVQGMAAELSTGALIMASLHSSDIKASMLLIETKATFSKKAVGTITFECNQGSEVSKAVVKSSTDGPQQMWLHACGIDSAGDEVSSFSFLWSIKAKN
ncbi:MAG: DUF4442 domain-containing protein [Flavobacteriaceae bacterium]